MPPALRLHLLLPVTLAILTIAALATSAHAGTYDVYSCRTPAGPEPALSGWSGTSNVLAGAVVGNTCGGVAADSAFGGSISADAVPSNYRALWQFDAPADTAITNYTLFRSVVSVPLPDRGSKGYALNEDELSFDPQHLVELCAAGSSSLPCSRLGDENQPFSESNRLTRTGRNAHRLFAFVACMDFKNCAATSSSARFKIFQAQIGLRDEQEPQATDVSGDITSDGVKRGLSSVSFMASDRGGGVERADLLVDGVPAASQSMEGRGAGCRRPFTVVVPCPLSLSVELPVDTTRLGDGIHRIQAQLTDAGGNVGRSASVFITTKNSTAPVIPNGVGADRRARLSVSFRGRSARAVRFGRTERATGRVISSTGQPIPGAYVGIYARVAQAGAHWRGVGIVRTGSAGRFRWRPRRGASRAFRFVYRAYSSDRRPASARTLNLRVRAGIRLSISPRSLRNGHTATFRVRLLGGPGRKGTLVSVQVLRPQRTTFATRGAGRDGAARVRHLFRYTYRPTTYFFRAVVQSQRGYPYLGAASRTVRFRVRP